MSSSENAAAADTLELSTGIVVIAVLGWLFSLQFSNCEQMVSHAVFDGIFNSQDRVDSASSVASMTDRSLGSVLMRFGITAGFATCGTIAAYQLSQSLRWVLFGQLLALNLVLHCILLMTGESLAMPISLLISSTVGIAYGFLMKRAKDTRQKLLAKDIAIETLTSELSDSKLQLIKDDETERRVLAGDLHDQVLNDLKLIRERLSKMSKLQPDSDPAAKPEDDSETDKQTKREREVQEIEQLIVRSMQQIREVMDSLSPAVLQHLGFVDAIEDCVRNGSERSGYKVRFRCNIVHNEFDCFSQTELTLLYRLVQESINNICKHANASIVRCAITADGDSVTISIADDGKGMDLSKTSAQSRGLQYMRQRASIIAATVNWLPGDENKGTTVVISIRKPEVIK